MAEEINEKTKEQKQPKKGMSAKAKYITLGVLAAVLIVAIVLCVVFLPKAKSEPQAVMGVSVNPDVQFVLDQNNKVMNVVSLNADGEKVILNTNFIGMSGDEAAILFLDTCVKLGYFDLDSNIGKEVKIVLSTKAGDSFTKFKAEVTNKANTYFKDNGIIAGATVSINNDIKSALVKISRDSADYAQKSEQELLNLIDQWSTELQGVAFNSRTALMQAINAVENPLMIDIETKNASIDALETVLNSMTDKASDSYKQEKEALELLRTTRNEKLTELNTLIDAKIKEFIANSTEFLKQIKMETSELYKTGVDTFKAYKKSIEDSLATRQAAIEDYQATLVQSAS